MCHITRAINNKCQQINKKKKYIRSIFFNNIEAILKISAINVEMNYNKQFPHSEGRQQPIYITNCPKAKTKQQLLFITPTVRAVQLSRLSVITQGCSRSTFLNFCRLIQPHISVKTAPCAGFEIVAFNRYLAIEQSIKFTA